MTRRVAAMIGYGMGGLHRPAAARLLVSVSLALAVLFGTLGQSFARSPWNKDYFPNVPVVTHDGQTYNFYEDLIKGKMVVITFIYTSCSNLCPLTTARLAQVKQMLGDRVGRDIFFYSITLDPVLDGPELLKKYAEAYHTGPGWLFLTGKPEDVDLIRQKLGERSKTPAEHRNDVMLGNDVTGQWSRDSTFSDIEYLANTIRDLDPEWRKVVRPVSGKFETAPATAVSNLTGQGLFIKACAGCHTTGAGTLVGPDLKGVTERRDHDWLRAYLKAPDEMRAQQDPLAVALDQQFPNGRMPNLGLSDGDIADLMTYLRKSSEQTATGSLGAPLNAVPVSAP